MKSSSFERFAGVGAILAGVLGFVYSYAFIFLVVRGGAPAAGVLISSATLLLGSLLSTTALVAIYFRVRDTEAAFALWAVMLGIIGTAGAAIHGGYDLANAINAPPTNTLALADLPSQIDPRGLLTFGLTGIAILFLAWLMGKSGLFPRALATLGQSAGILLVIIYLGRLILLDPNNLLIGIPALLTGFVLNPLWYIWLGLTFLRSKQANPSRRGNDVQPH